MELPFRIDDRERLEVAHERPHGQATAVDVGGHGAPQREAVGPGLLLGDRQRLGGPLLRAGQPLDERGPLDPRFHLDGGCPGVEPSDAVQAARVDEEAVLGEGLPAHRVAAAGHAHRQPLPAGPAHRLDERIERRHGHDLADAGGVEP